MKRSVYILILVLAACGSPFRPVPVPTPPPSVVWDIATLIFSTPCRNIGGNTTVCDKIAPDGKITRITYTKDNHLGLGGEEIETRSIYQIDTARNCIAVVQEETRIHVDGSLQALQVYQDAGLNAPCWIRTLHPTTQLKLETSGEYTYLWSRFDATGSPSAPSRGRFSDSTLLVLESPVSTLTERYQDTSGIDPNPPVYCGVSTFGDSGMITVRQDPGACK